MLALVAWAGSHTRILTRTISEHVTLSAVSLAIAVAIAIPLGIALHRWTRAASPIVARSRESASDLARPYSASSCLPRATCVASTERNSRTPLSDSAGANVPGPPPLASRGFAYCLTQVSTAASSRA